MSRYPIRDERYDEIGPEWPSKGKQVDSLDVGGDGTGGVKKKTTQDLGKCSLPLFSDYLWQGTIGFLKAKIEKVETQDDEGPTKSFSCVNEEERQELTDTMLKKKARFKCDDQKST